MKKWIGLFVMVGAASLGRAQQFTLSEVYAGTAGQPVGNSLFLQDSKYGEEFWVLDTKTRSYEGISPQLKYRQPGITASIGAYSRWTDNHMVRSGVSGFFSLGDAKGWRLDGPYYLFQTDPAHKTGMWLPNTRLTYPVGKDCRIGLGCGDSTIQGAPRSTAVGLFLGIQTKEWSFMARAGFMASPGVQHRADSLFLILGRKF